MNGASSRTRRARFMARHYQLGRRRRETGLFPGAQRSRQRRLSRAAGLTGSIIWTGPGQVSCLLPSHICVSVCRHKSLACPGGLRRESVAGASWSADLEEMRDDG